jgi:HD-GYP domain-containing protein (c-di-GMP phosphodiesterase class II)
MKLAIAVKHPENPSQDLLRAGFTLEDTILARMRAMGISMVYVEYPALECIDKHLAVQLSPSQQVLYKQISTAIGSIQKRTRPAISYRDYCDITQDMVSTILTQGQNPLYLGQMARQGGDAVGHASSVAHLALLMGIKLDQYLIEQRPRLAPNRAKDIVNLGVAGMLHDLGVSSLPEHLWRYSDADPPQKDEDLREWRTHSELAYELVRNDVEPSAAAAVYQHHQHFDGSGFPERTDMDGSTRTMAGQNIHVFARILMVANLFDRLSTPVHGGRRRPNAEVHNLLRTKYTTWCDPAILRVLLTVAPAYPPGCRLSLSDGSRAIVTDVNPLFPLKPIVRRLAEDNWTLLGGDIDLSASGSPEILAAAA